MGTTRVVTRDHTQVAQVEGEMRVECPPQQVVGCSGLWVEVDSIAGMDGWGYCA